MKQDPKTIINVTTDTGLNKNPLVRSSTTPVVTSSESTPMLQLTTANANILPGTVTSFSVVSGGGLSIGGSPITTSGTITITNTGVTKLTAGTGVTLSGSNGNVTISASVPNNVGTVTSVGLVAGAGMQVVGNPVTSNGSFTVVNTGVTRLTAGTGITLSGSNGNVIVSAANASANATYTNATLGNATVTGNLVAATVVANHFVGDGSMLTNIPIPSSTVSAVMKLTPGSAPSDPTAGTIYYDRVINTLRCYNGTVWKSIAWA